MKVNRVLFEQLIREELEAVLTGKPFKRIDEIIGSGDKSQYILNLLKSENPTAELDCKKFNSEMKKVEDSEGAVIGWSPWTDEQEEAIAALSKICKDRKSAKKWGLDQDEAEKQLRGDEEAAMKVFLPSEVEKRKAAEKLKKMSAKEKKEELAKAKNFWIAVGDNLADFSEGFSKNAFVKFINDWALSSDDLIINSIAIVPYRAWVASRMPAAAGPFWARMKAQGHRMYPGRFRMMSMTSSRLTAAQAAMRATGRRALMRYAAVAWKPFEFIGRQIISGPLGLFWAGSELFSAVLDLIGNWDELTGQIDKRPMEYKELVDQLRVYYRTFADKNKLADFKEGLTTAKNAPELSAIDLVRWNNKTFYKYYIKLEFNDYFDKYGGLKTIKGGAGEDLSASAAKYTRGVVLGLEELRRYVYAYWSTGDGAARIEKELKNPELTPEQRKKIKKMIANIGKYNVGKSRPYSAANTTEDEFGDILRADDAAERSRELAAARAELRDPSKKPTRRDSRYGDWIWRDEQWTWQSREPTAREAAEERQERVASLEKIKRIMIRRNKKYEILDKTKKPEWKPAGPGRWKWFNRPFTTRPRSGPGKNVTWPGAWAWVSSQRRK